MAKQKEEQTIQFLVLSNDKKKKTMAYLSLIFNQNTGISSTWY